MEKSKPGSDRDRLKAYFQRAGPTVRRMAKNGHDAGSSAGCVKTVGFLRTLEAEFQVSLRS